MTDDDMALLARLPGLLRESPQLRYQIFEILTEQFVTRQETTRLLDELRAHREESNRRFDAQQEQMDRRFDAQQEQMDRRFEAADRRFEGLLAEAKADREETNRRFEALHGEVRELGDKVTTLDGKVTTLGSRWGIQTEGAVREFARGFIGREFGVQSGRWTHGDVELDLVVHDGRHCLIEVKSRCDPRDVRRLIEGAAAYEQETGQRPTRLIFVTAHVTTAAWRLAQEQGVEVFTE